MSVLEDVLDLLRTVLEYFGVPQEMLVPGWDSELCGQYRSIVRMIGTNIPMTPTPRVHFQIPLHTYRSHGCVDVTMDTHAIPSFADVMWLADDEGDRWTKIRNQLPPSNHVVRRDVDRGPVGPPSRAHRRAPLMGQNSDPEALRKISFLEAELLKLRAQIAVIVTAPPGKSERLINGAPTSYERLRNVPPLLEDFLSPCSPPAHTPRSLSPNLTSTPRSAPPPPPPPPPLPPPSSGHAASDERLPLCDLIRQRKANNAQGSGPAQGSAAAKPMPSMLDVLKDLNSVTLRSVKRSPGGRPVKPRRSGGTGLAPPSDPASLIAEALRKKFAHHLHNNSSDKENSMERSPFGSPDSPRVFQPSRRSRGRLHL